MASPQVAGPFKDFFRDRYGQGQGEGQRFGSFRPPFERRPMQGPSTRRGRPGPAPLGPGRAPLEGGVEPLGPIETPSAQQARSRSQQRRRQSRRRVKKLSAQQFGREGGTEEGLDPGSILGQLRGALGGMFSGQTSKAFVDRARNALGGAVEGQRAQAVKRIDADAIRRGLFKSGIPSEQAAAAGTAAQGAFSQGLADILSQAEQQDIQGRQFATTAGAGLLGQNRAFDEALQQRIEAARRGGRGGPGTQTIIDPDTGQAYDVGSDILRYL